MGFLDHSTNNIVVDAVLTDTGRRLLARNDGSFQIFQFALGDDEIDYSIIQKFGRTVGKEKIEKNTPVLEALTNSDLAIKNKLVSISNEFLTHFPTLDLTSSESTVTFNRLSNIGSKNIELSISSQTGTSIEFGLLDGELILEMNHLFLSVSGFSPDIVYSNNIAVYRIPTGRQLTGREIKTTVPIRLKKFSNTTHSTYSAQNQSYVRTFIKARGNNSGLTKTIEVQIS